jgi:G3E family GTPase
VIPLQPLTLTQAQSLDKWLRILVWEKRLITTPSNASPWTGLIGGRDEIEVLRCKGAYTTTEDKEFVIQGVRELYEIKELGPSSPGGSRGEGKIVLIGWLGSSKEAITSSLRQSLGV